jgi:hypothetical protein
VDRGLSDLDLKVVIIASEIEFWEGTYILTKLQLELLALSTGQILVLSTVHGLIGDLVHVHLGSGPYALRDRATFHLSATISSDLQAKW